MKKKKRDGYAIGELKDKQWYAVDQVCYWTTDESVCPSDHTEMELMTHISVGNQFYAKGRLCKKCCTVYINTTHLGKEFTQHLNQKRQQQNLARRTAGKLQVPASIIPDELQKLPVHRQRTDINNSILTAHLMLPDGLMKDITITDETTKRVGCYFIERSLSAIVLSAIFLNRKVFNYKGCDVELYGFQKGNRYDEYNQRVKTFLDPNRLQMVVLYRHKHLLDWTNCELVTALIYFPKVQKLIPMTVYHNTEHNWFYMNETSYNQYRAKYGLPYFDFICHARDGGQNHNLAWNLTSKLKLCGYSVAKADGLTVEDRRDLLRQIVDNRIISRAMIINHLEFLIRLHEDDPVWQDATSSWKNDLDYMLCYQETQQPVILGEIVRP